MAVENKDYHSLIRNFNSEDQKDEDRCRQEFVSQIVDHSLNVNRFEEIFPINVESYNITYSQPVEKNS